MNRAVRRMTVSLGEMACEGSGRQIELKQEIVAANSKTTLLTGGADGRLHTRLSPVLPEARFVTWNGTPPERGAQMVLDCNLTSFPLNELVWTPRSEAS